MGEEKCPFLEMTTVTFCKAFPVKKMIPVDRATSSKGLCHTGEYRLCSAYREIEGHGSTVETVRGFALRPDYYFHPRHLWVSSGREADPVAKVGIDDFSQRLVGRINRVSLPPEGSVVKENSVCFLLHSGDRTARMVAPGDGIVREINQKVSDDPGTINRDPYEEGWIFSMHLTGEWIPRLYHGSVARQWLDWEAERLQRMFCNDLGITATDGGEALPDISSRLNEAQWSRIVALFLG
ncbi:MAG TPA: glycine cleavage system protein H [Candidatus Deferrimicrobiaceae bacterium]|nr:glycine cleavage system protein H [Candidatus Deferrimicrobiaceae bacterium]